MNAPAHSESKLGPRRIEPTLHIQNGTDFDIFSLKFHNHFFDDVACSYRFELRITILGIGIGIAYVQLYD
jgi:hypothetical protein